MAQPQYSSDTQSRIQAAISRAQASTRRAHWTGRNERLQCTIYAVYSSHYKHVTYTVRAFDRPTLGAFVYLKLLRWIACDCEAGLHSSPCFHAARVALRLQREAGPVEKPAETTRSDYSLIQADCAPILAEYQGPVIRDTPWAHDADEQRRAEKARKAAQLEAIFSEPLTATEQRRANQLQRTYGK